MPQFQSAYQCMPPNPGANSACKYVTDVVELRARQPGFTLAPAAQRRAARVAPREASPYHASLLCRSAGRAAMRIMRALLLAAGFVVAMGWPGVALAQAA